MKYLITGGTGFIGTNISLRLLKQGHQVTVLDNFSASSDIHLKNSLAKVVYGDVTDKSTVFSLVKKCDYTIHLAAVVGVRLAMLKGIEGLHVSYEGSKNVLEAVSAYDREVFIASSSGIYGKLTSRAVSEYDDSLIGPSKKSSWLYSVAKLTEEHLAFSYHRELGTKVKIARFFNVIGPYQTGRYGMVVPTFINQALDNKPLLVYGSGQQTRTFCYIEDALDGLELFINEGKIGDVCNIGGTEEISIQALAEKIIYLTNSNSRIELIPYDKAFDENFEETIQRVPNISKLEGLGYKPRFSLDEALLNIISYEKQERQNNRV